MSLPRPIELTLRIDDNSHVPAYRQIANHLNCTILSGQLPCGVLLPQIRNLATQLGINPNTVARAYTELAELGLIQTRQGSGCFVADGIKPAPALESKSQLLAERIDELVVAGAQLGVSINSLISMLQDRIPKTPAKVSRAQIKKPVPNTQTNVAPDTPNNLWQAADSLID